MGVRHAICSFLAFWAERKTEHTFKDTDGLRDAGVQTVNDVLELLL